MYASRENANVTPALYYDYGSPRCQCVPGVPCAACQAQARQTVSVGSRQAKDTIHRRGAMTLAEARQQIRTRVATWLADHGRLFTLSELTQAYKAYGTRLTPAQIYWAYSADGGLEGMLEDCVRHGVCTAAQVRALQHRRRRILQGNSVKGGKAMAEKRKRQKGLS